MLDELKQQYTLNITQANRSQLVVILYEMVLIYVKDAETSHENEERVEFRQNIRRARGCISELMSTLDFKYSISSGLMQLYLYVNRELARADIRNNPEPLEGVKIVINGLHETFEVISEQDTSGPLMQNTQTVFAGLTYSKNNLNESLSNQRSDRGFLA